MVRGHPRESLPTGPSPHPALLTRVLWELVEKAAVALRPRRLAPEPACLCDVCEAPHRHRVAVIFVPLMKPGQAWGSSVLEPSSLRLTFLGYLEGHEPTASTPSPCPSESLARLVRPSPRVWELWKQGVRNQQSPLRGGL